MSSPPCVIFGELTPGLHRHRDSSGSLRDVIWLWDVVGFSRVFQPENSEVAHRTNHGVLLYVNYPHLCYPKGQPISGGHGEVARAVAAMQISASFIILFLRTHEFLHSNDLVFELCHEIEF